MRPILDVYDDPSGSILKRSFPTMDAIPSFIKGASVIEGTEPDSDFALVLHESGGRKLRKFAHVDKGNTALSVIYFLETSGGMESDLKEKVAGKLVAACKKYSLKAPELLKEAAEKSLVDKMVDKSPPTSAMPSSTVPGNDVSNDSDFKWIEGFHKDVQSGMAPETKWHKLEKTASPSPFLEGPVRTAITGYNVIKKLLPKQDKYPIGGENKAERSDRAKHAAAYFSEWGQDFHPRDRHTYCRNLRAELEDLGESVSHNILKYASAARSRSFEMLTSARMIHLDDAGRDVLNSVLEKAAYVDPEIAAEMLNEFDTAFGLDSMWGKHVADPWQTCFHLEKAASVVFEGKNGPITDEDLQLLAETGRDKLSTAFGPEFTQQFVQEPVEAFEALPGVTKHVIAGMI